MNQRAQRHAHPPRAAPLQILQAVAFLPNKPHHRNKKAVAAVVACLQVRVFKKSGTELKA